MPVGAPEIDRDKTVEVSPKLNLFRATRMNATGEPPPSTRDLVIDTNRSIPAPKLYHQRTQHIVVVRFCYMTIQEAHRDLDPDVDTIIVGIREPGRALRESDMAAAFQPLKFITIEYSPEVSRTVDAGLLPQRTLHKSFKPLQAILDRASKP